MATRGVNISTKEYKDRRHETIIGQMTIVFGLLVLSIFTLFMLKGSLFSPRNMARTPTTYSPLTYLPVLPLVFFVLTITRRIKKLRAKADERLIMFSSSFLLYISTTLFLSTLLLSNLFVDGFKPAVAVITISSLLFFSKHSFPESLNLKLFFNAGVGFSFYITNLLIQDAQKILVLLFILLDVLLIISLFLFKKNHGTIKGFTLLKPASSFIPIFISSFLQLLLLSLLLFGCITFTEAILILAAETILFTLFYAIKMLK